MGLVALSLSKTIKTFPAVGWVRASEVSNEKLLGELNELRKDNSALRTELSKVPTPTTIYAVDDIADLDDEFSVTGTYFTNAGKRSWKVSISWKEIFAIISPYLAKTPDQDYVKEILKTGIIERDGLSTRTNSLNDQDMQTVAVQLKALGLIETNYRQTVGGGMALFWSFTPEGERLMVQLRAIRKAK